MIPRTATRALVTACFTVLAVTGAAAGQSTVPKSAGHVDVLAQAGFIRIDGAQAGDLIGKSVAGAGDVNGDGRPDILVGANARSSELVGYVVFGQDSPTNVDLAKLGGHGFRIDGQPDGGIVRVAAAGDVNGDGRTDVLVGARDASNNGWLSSGSVWVVFGKGSSERVDLAALGQGGFRIDGATAFDVVNQSCWRRGPKWGR